MKVRRVVTGHTSDGSATMASDTEVDAITLSLMPGTEFCRLWGADEAPAFPDAGSPPTAPAYFPPVGGFRFGVVTVGPDSVAMPKDLDLQLAMAEIEDRCRTEPGTPGATRARSLAGWSFASSARTDVEGRAALCGGGSRGEDAVDRKR